jgi:hypothetical protein
LNIFRSLAWGVMCITGGVAQRNRRIGFVPNWTEKIEFDGYAVLHRLQYIFILFVIEKM